MQLLGERRFCMRAGKGDVTAGQFSFDAAFTLQAAKCGRHNCPARSTQVLI